MFQKQNEFVGHYTIRKPEARTEPVKIKDTFVYHFYAFGMLKEVGVVIFPV